MPTVFSVMITKEFIERYIIPMTLGERKTLPNMHRYIYTSGYLLGTRVTVKVSKQRETKQTRILYKTKK